MGFCHDKVILILLKALNQEDIIQISWQLSPFQAARKLFG
jgi:hypothetical protein